MNLAFPFTLTPFPQSLYLLTPTFSIKGVNFHVTMIFVFPFTLPPFLQSLYILAPRITLKIVHFHVSMDLAFSFTSPPFPPSLYIPAPIIFIHLLGVIPGRVSWFLCDFSGEEGGTNLVHIFLFIIFYI